MQFISSLLSLALNLRIMCITSLPQNPNSLYQGVAGKDLENEGGKDSSCPFFGCSRRKKTKKQKKKVRIREGKIPSLTGPLLQSIHKLIAEKEGIRAKYLV